MGNALNETLAAVEHVIARTEQRSSYVYPNAVLMPETHTRNSAIPAAAEGGIAGASPLTHKSRRKRAPANGLLTA